MIVSQIRGIFHFISVFLNLIIAFLLWFRGKSKATFHLGWVAFFSAIYALVYGIIYFFEKNTLFLTKATWLGVLILPAYITFVYCFTKRTKYLKLKSFFWYSGAIIISYLSLATPYIEKGVNPKYPFFYSEEYGPLAPLGRIYIIICLAISLFYLLKDYFRNRGFRKLQLQYFIFGTSIYVVGGMFTAGVIPLFYPRFAYIDVSAFLSIFWVGLTTYAILKKKLFEIKIILTEMLVGIMGVTLATLPFLMPTDALKILTSVIFFLFCLFGYYLVKAMYNEIRNKERLEKFKIASDELKTKLVPTLELENVTSSIADTLMKTFPIDKISFAIKQPTGEFYEIWNNIGFDKKEIGSLITDTFLCDYITRIKKPLVAEKMPLPIESTESQEEKWGLKIIQEKMKRNKIDILFPLFQKKMLVGIFFLGPKSPGMAFSEEEIELLECLSYQIAISINNTLLFREISKDKEMFEKFREKTLERGLRIEELKQKIKELEEKLKEKER